MLKDGLTGLLEISEAAGKGIWRALRPGRGRKKTGVHTAFAGGSLKAKEAAEKLGRLPQEIPIPCLLMMNRFRWGQNPFQVEMQRV